MVFDLLQSERSYPTIPLSEHFAPVPIISKITYNHLINHHETVRPMGTGYCT